MAGAPENPYGPEATLPPDKQHMDIVQQFVLKCHQHRNLDYCESISLQKRIQQLKTIKKIFQEKHSVYFPLDVI